MGMTLVRLICRELAQCETQMEEEQCWQRILDTVHRMHRDFMDHNTIQIPREDEMSRRMVFGLQQTMQELRVKK